MAKGKARTDAQKERAKDLRIQHDFGITLADRTERCHRQGDKCAICGGPLDPPVIDHYHFKRQAFRYFDLDSADISGWQAEALDERGQVKCMRRAKTKEAALRAVKMAYIIESIRGILCIKCNYGLGCIERFFDAAAHPENLLPVYKYLLARIQNPA